MNPQRWLCSQLVTLHEHSGAARVVNLEEIWRNGAVLEAEQPIEEGARIEIRAGNVFFAGGIARVERHEFGWRLEVEFSPLTLWSPEVFRPEHLLDPSSLP